MDQKAYMQNVQTCSILKYYTFFYKTHKTQNLKEICTKSLRLTLQLVRLMSLQPNLA